MSNNTILQKIDKYIIEIKFANAVSLAHKGHYAQAEALISEILHDQGKTTSVLDLQARIYAQQGRFFEAEAKWRRALQLDPSNNAYQKILQRISHVHKRPIWLMPLLFIIVSLLLVITIIDPFAIVKTPEKNFANEFSPSLQIQITKDEFLKHLTKLELTIQNLKNGPTSMPEHAFLLQIQKIETELSKKLTGLETVLQGLKLSSASLLLTNLSLNISGILTETDGNGLIIIFEDGLFKKGAILKPEAKEMLIKLGKQLEKYSSRIYIKIYGITDDIPIPEANKYRDNIDLGKARAIAVFDHLRETTNLIPERMLIGSFGEYLPSFPNSTYEGRFKNRTVVIKISKDISG